jgi:hypothetical protein
VVSVNSHILDKQAGSMNLQSELDHLFGSDTMLRAMAVPAQITAAEADRVSKSARRLRLAQGVEEKRKVAQQMAEADKLILCRCLADPEYLHKCIHR